MGWGIPVTVLVAVAVATLAFSAPALLGGATRSRRLVGAAALLPLLLLLPARATLALAGLLGAAFLLRWLYRRNCAQREARRHLADLPTLVDALVLGVETGQSLFPAFLEARRILPPASPLARAITRMEEMVRLGRPQAEAIEEMAARIPEGRTQAFLETLAQSLRLGTPIARVLRDQSRLAREHLLLDAEQHANTLAIRLLLPLFLFILPAAFLLIISPVVLAVLEAPPW